MEVATGEVRARICHIHMWEGSPAHGYVFLSRCGDVVRARRWPHIRAPPRPPLANTGNCVFGCVAMRVARVWVATCVYSTRRHTIAEATVNGLR